MNSAGCRTPTTATVGKTSSIAKSGIAVSKPPTRRPRRSQSRLTASVARHAAAARQVPSASRAAPVTAKATSVSDNDSADSAGSYARDTGTATPSDITIASAAGNTRKRNSHAARDFAEYRARRRAARALMPAIAADEAIDVRANDDKPIAAAKSQNLNRLAPAAGAFHARAVRARRAASRRAC